MPSTFCAGEVVVIEHAKTIKKSGGIPADNWDTMAVVHELVIAVIPARKENNTWIEVNSGTGIFSKSTADSIAKRIHIFCTCNSGTPILFFMGHFYHA